MKRGDFHQRMNKSDHFNECRRRENATRAKEMGDLPGEEHILLRWQDRDGPTGENLFFFLFLLISFFSRRASSMSPFSWSSAPLVSSLPLTVLSSQSGSRQLSLLSAPSSSSLSSQTCSKQAFPTLESSRGQPMRKQKTLRGRSSSQMGLARLIDLLLEPKKSR